MNFQLFLLLLLNSPLLSQKNLQVNIPQNIFNIEDKINCVISIKDKKLKTCPATIDVISVSTLKLKSQLFFTATNNPSCIAFNIPEADEGSYIVHVHLKDINENRVIESHMFMVHLLSNGTNEKYYRFKQENKLEHTSSIDIYEKLRSRSRLLKETNDTSSIVYSIDESYFFSPSYRYYSQPGTIDTIHKYYFKLPDANNIYSCIPAIKKTNKLKQAKDKWYLEITDTYKYGFYLYDLFQSTKVDWEPEMLDYSKLRDELLTLSPEDIEKINSLGQNASLTKKIGILLEDSNPINNAVKLPKINGDNNYEQGLYPPFENLNLFIKEVIYPFKVVTSKLDKNKKEIYLLSGIDKKWFNSKCLLLTR